MRHTSKQAWAHLKTLQALTRPRQPPVPELAAIPWGAHGVDRGPAWRQSKLPITLGGDKRGRDGVWSILPLPSGASQHETGF